MPDRAVDRRSLLRRAGVVAAGVAGAAMLPSLTPEQASAADNGNLLIGTANAASSTTSLSSTGGGPTLMVESPDGTVAPLQLVDQPYPLSGADNTIAAGDLVSRDGVLYFGQGDGYTGTVLTDLMMPLTLGIDPVRQLDTRSSNGRLNLRSTSFTSAAGSLDSKGRLKAGSTVYLLLGDYAYSPTAVFGNLTCYLPTAAGRVTIYPGETERPATATINFPSGGAPQNAFAVGATNTSNGATPRPTLTIYTTVTTHLIVDVTALTDYYSFANPTIGTAQLSPSTASRPRQLPQPQHLRRPR